MQPHRFCKYALSGRVGQICPRCKRGKQQGCTGDECAQLRVIKSAVVWGTEHSAEGSAEQE